MATRTASVSGLASNTATWGGSPVPVDGDAIIVNAGVIVTWDLNNSAFVTGLIASTINGSIICPTSAGTYEIACGGTFTWGAAASLKANSGVDGQPLPANVTFRQRAIGNINLNSLNSTTVVDLISQEPAHRYVKLSGAEAAGQTVLSVDTDLTGDPAWVGAIVHINDVNGQDSEERTITAISATDITVTPALTNAKIIGALVILVSRNVKIVGAGTGTAFAGSPNATTRIRAEIRNFANGFGNSGGAYEVGGVIANMTANGIGANTSGIQLINAAISKCNPCVSAGWGHLFDNCIISGGTTNIQGGSAYSVRNSLISGGSSGVGSNPAGHRFYNTEISGNTSGVDQGSGLEFYDCILRNNTARDVDTTGSFIAYNTLFGSSTEYTNNASFVRTIEQYSESIDHDQVAGAYKAWVRGGIVTSVVSPVFDPSRPRSYQHACLSASFPSYMKREVFLPPGATMSVTCRVTKDASMGGYMPRLWIFGKNKQPLITGSPDAEAIMQNDTTSTSTWETLTATVTNTSDVGKTYVVMTLAKNASGNVYFDPIIRQSSYGYLMGDAA